MPRLVPQLDGTGKDGGLKGGDDFNDKVTKTIGDFLKEAVDDPDAGKKNSDDRPFTDDTTLANHENTTFFNRLEGSDYNKLREVLDDNLKSGVGQEDILAAIDGFAGGATPTDDATAQPTPEAAAVVGAVSKVLTQNRFSQTSTYGDQFDDNGSIAVMPTSLGSFNPDGAQARLEDLKKVGLSLMLRATGEFIDGDPTAPGVSLGSLLPGQAQLGLKIDARNLEADNVFGAPGRDPNAGPIRARVKDIIAGRSPRSFGQLNSCNEPFDGFLPLGMTGLAIILVVALRLIATGLIRLIGLIAGKPFGPGAGKLSTDPLAFGQYGRQASTNPLMPLTLNDIGIMELDRDFTACVDEGLKVFFSFRGEDFGRVARSPGFYANMVRVIVQSAARIINDVVEAFKTLAGGNVVAGAQAILGIAGVLKTSKVIAFLNIMAVLGDRSFARQDAGVDRAPRGSIVDAIPDNAASRIMKSRVKGPGGATTLAWRNAAPVSSLHMPLDFLRASSKLNTDFARYVAMQSDLRGEAEVPFEAAGGRFSPDEVAEIERRLDAEYVPFYFQDLRTNEIASFHAFIASVNESFTPVYSETSPYGRIDPVMTYGSTRREFSFSFHIVATSPDDFDAMYVKLNKLGTLVYPQFTRGRSVVDRDGNQFIQPFSQVPGASPLCRIRLGNLMRTNFSNLALARLFGLGADDFLDKKPAQAQAELFEQKLGALKKQIETVGWTPGQSATILPAGFKQLNSRASLLPPPLQGVTDQDVIRNFNRIAERPALVQIKTPALTKMKFRNVDERFYKVEFKEQGLDGVEITVPESVLTINIGEVENGLPAPPDIDAAIDDAQTEFFRPENNAIVRSFQNTQGKGLAGFITSMNFDWNEADGSWDVERFSARAPQLTKVDINFTVIHDIPPGLDSDGMNRAPLWYTGDTMMKTWGDAYDTEGEGEAHFNEVYGRIKGKG